ncbi:hypothetical protein QFZ23_000200 [Arthrobacter globiformis]|jgi:hypothetical protein|uniref:hypothetical protein n=1 Tax=Arthrobacter globiformis TaxID=1665 RepID=UPI002787EE3B|nr:hypothetical protein [Arthrobacter globiformis]MDQ1056299.1 hypothetical protein [Arthrobacter globiformis]
MLRKLQEILSGRDSSGDAGPSGPDSASAQPQFDGRLLDRKREDVYTLMHQQMSSLR